MAANLAARLEQQPELNLADVAYTLQVGRTPFDYRRVVVAADGPAVVAALRAGAVAVHQPQRHRPVALLLPGTAAAADLLGPAQTLYAREPAFRTAVEQGCAALRPHLGRDLLPRFAAPGDAPAEPASAEALLWVVEYALAQLVGTWGIRPAALLGVGVGEYVAACLAGVLSLADAAALVAARGHAAPAPPAVTFQPPRVPYISQLSGTWITAAEATDPAYWTRLQAQPGDAAVDLAALCAAAQQVYLEVGPGAALSARVAAHVAAMDASTPAVIAVLGERGAAEAGTGLPDTLGRLWLAGVEVDWTGVHAGAARQRVMLPTYPFERQRYWLEPNRQHVASGSASPMDDEPAKQELADWFYAPSWKRSNLLQTGAQSDIREKHCWLLFLDDCGIGAQLGERLARDGHDVVGITPGHTFAPLGPSAYVIRPGAREDYEIVLQDLRAQGRAPSRVAHLWSVTPPQDRPVDDNIVAESLNTGFFSLLALAQALGDGSTACEINVISTGLREVTYGDTVEPEKALITGPFKVIPKENANVECRSIDIRLPGADGWSAAALLDQLVEELARAVSDSVIALRGPHRWVQIFEGVHLDAPGRRTHFRAGGVYLITGGLGGIGLALAEHLAHTHGAKLALVGRSELPPRDQWEQILATQGDAEGIGYKLGKLRALEAAGAEVLVAAADVADYDEMHAVVRQVVARWGTINGVIHAAGLPPGGVIQLKTPDMALRVLAPKVMGTLVLERVLEDIPLDFLVLFSSMSAITSGGPGQIDYCSANAFVDAYAQRYHDRHGQTVSIGWGEWQWDAWGEGLAGFPEEVQTFFKWKRREYGIPFDEGCEALQRILGTRLPHVVVATQDFPTMIESGKSFSIAKILERVKQHRREQPRHPRPALATSYVVPGTELEERLEALWSDLLGIEQIGIHDNFFELGGNSLLGVDLIARMRQDLNIETIPTHVLYEAPTISTLAQFLAPVRPAAEVVEESQDRGERRREKLKQMKQKTQVGM
nr:SDR family NAD(P)-dependent oxidoreductase [uncultured Sphingomonas sp.]